MKEDIELPSRMIPDAEMACLVIDNANRAHWKYHQMITKQKDHLDGAPPFRPEVLKQHEQQWRHNRNYFKATAKIDKVTIESNAAVNGSLANSHPIFRPWTKKEHGDDEKKLFLRDDVLRFTYAMDISRAYADAFEKDDQSIDHVSQVNFNARAWGVGWIVKEPGTRPHWIGKQYDIRDIKLPKRTSRHELNKFTAEEEWDLLNFYRKWLENTDPASKWFSEGLEELLLHYGNKWRKGKDQRARAWETIGPEYHQSAGLICESSDAVRFTKLFNEEVDGSLTVTYIATIGQNNTRPVSAAQEGFTPKHLLYQKNFANTRLKDVLFPVRDSAITSTGCVQDMRGLAHQAVPDSHSFNKDMCSMQDKKLLYGLPQFAQTSANRGEKFRIGVTGAGLIWPENFEFLEHQFKADLKPLIDSMQISEAAYRRETQHHDPTIQDRLGDRATTREVQTANREVQFAKTAKDSIFLKDWAHVHESNLRSLSKKGAFKKEDPGYVTWRMFIDDLRETWKLEDDDTVFAILAEVREFSLEGIATDLEAIQRAIEVTKDPSARVELERQYLFALGVPRKRIDRLRPRTEDQDGTGSSAEIHAELQNNAFWTRGGQLLDRGSDIRAQLDVHFRLFEGALMAYNEGFDAQKTAIYLKNGTQHTAKLVLLMEQDRFYKEVVDQYIDLQRQIEAAAGRVEAEAVRQAKALAREQEQASDAGLTPKDRAEAELRRFETLTKLDRQAMNQEAKRAMMEQNQAFTQELRQREAASDQAIRVQEAQSERAIRIAEAETDRQLKLQKAQSE